MATETQLRDYLKRATVELSEARRRIGELTDAGPEPIAVTGMACRYPGGGDTVEGFWDLLADGRTGVVDVPASRWDIDAHYDPDRSVAGAVYTRHGSFLPDIAGWDNGFFGHSPQEALRMDPQQRLLMELVQEGFENAGIAPSAAAGSRTAVMVGFMDTVQYGRIETECYGPGIAADPYFGQGVSASVVAGRLAYHYDLRGAAVTLDTACSSSLVGVHLASQALRRGECDLALAGGAFLIMKSDVYVQGCATSMLSPQGRCATFDDAADGYVMGEGGGMVVLERLSSALRHGRRIHAVLRGSAVNQDGRSNGLTAPSRGAQVDVVRQALAAARVHPDDVDYVEAHGSATQLGDAIELSALHDVFGGRAASRPLAVGAVKTNLGHTQAAAGIAGLIKTVLVLERGQVPGNLHQARPATAVPSDGTIRPVVEALPLPVGPQRRALAGVSSFGWSGTNAHVVLEAAPALGQVAETASAPRMLPLSAASPTALRAQIEQLAARLTADPSLDTADVAHTLAVGRSAYEFRLAVPVPVGVAAPDALRAALGRAEGARRIRPQVRVAFLLAGTGDQYAGAARSLYRSEPVFTAAVQECLQILTKRCGVDLGSLIDPAETPADGPDTAAGGAAAVDLAAMLGRSTDGATADPLEQAELAHPYLFMIEYALAKLLLHRGIRPDVLIGYSLGEYVAACLGGVFALDDALHVVVERARLIASAAAGQMLAVAAGEPVVRAALAAARAGDPLGAGAEIDVAALNGPAMTVLSGTAVAVAALAERLLGQGIACRPLRTAHAFHSSLLEPVRDKLAALVGSVPRQAPHTAIVSNRTGVLLTNEEATSPEYWAEHLVSPVRFAAGIAHCLEQSVDVFVELGCGQTLGGLARQNLPGDAGVELLGTLPARWSAVAGPAAPADLSEDLLRTCGRLWENGVDVDWAATRPAADRAPCIVTLPTYPFQRTAFWPEGSTTPAEVLAVVSGPRDLCHVPSWRPDPDRRAGELALPGPLVVVGQGAGLATRLADLAARAGVAVRAVSGVEGLGTLTTLPGTGPVTVVHLDGLHTTGRSPAADTTLVEAVHHGFDSLLLTLQALSTAAPGRAVRLLTVSRGALEVLGGEALAPQQSLAHGLGRSARLETPGLTWSGVDLDPVQSTDAHVDAEAALAQLVRELAAAPDLSQPTVTAWRRGRRWLPEFAELTPVDAGPATDPTDPTDPTDAPVWRPDGVYLITGGTRGLGLALARHLVGAGVRRLGLVSRSALVDDLTLDGWRAAGVEVLLLAADTGEPEQLRAALRRCRNHFGALNGVVHAAGVPATGLLARATVAGAGRVLAPKIRALGPLAELVGPGTAAAERPELLVLYSSAITAYGGIGEGDYCAANTVLDAYGTALAATAPSTRVVSLAWGPWQHDDWQGGEQAGPLAERALAYRRTYGFTDEGGCALLDRVLGDRTLGGQGAVLAVRQPLAEVLRDWSATLDLDGLVGESAARPAAERFSRPALRVDFLAPRTTMETLVAEAWGSFLGIDQVGVHDPFFDLGGNSLVGMAMVHDVEKTLGRAIAPALLFAHPTVAEFAAALDPDGDEDNADHLLTSSARGQRRRRSRAGARR